MSAVIPLQLAMDAKILADVTLAAKLGGEKVYSLSSPEDDGTLPYIVLGQSTETRRRTFDSKFHDGIETLDIWSADITKQEAAGIYADLERLLDGVPLVLTGTGAPHFVTGELTLIALLIDPSGKYAHASCRYAVLSYA